MGSQSAELAYSLTRPDSVYELPGKLNEVSGITDISDSEVGCVQDEEGAIFVYDLVKRGVTKEIRFGAPGDYEGLTRVGSRFFVLRSDGLLYEISGSWDKPSVKTHSLGLPTSNNEGLAHDAQGQRILIAPKSRAGKGKEFKDSRPIFAFDLARSTATTDPVFDLSVSDIRAFAERLGSSVPEKQKKHGSGSRVALRFMPSSLSVHPITKELFVVSAMDRVLVAFDSRGKPSRYASLDPHLFHQPEGITFLSGGDMIIANEAAERTATLLLFKWRGKQRREPGPPVG